jgi:uncharacterized protein YukJ
MALKTYGILKGKAVVGKEERDFSSPHYQVYMTAGGADFRIAINVRSSMSPPDLLFLVDENFRHPLTEDLSSIQSGFTEVERKKDGLALDFIRGNLLDRRMMKSLPHDIPNPDNDLNDKLNHYIWRAIHTPNAIIYAWGDRWGPENNKEDKIFGFKPGNGIHDIHMNQGSTGRFTDQNGVWQDGALMIHFPSEDRWVALFAGFQSQSWHTDDHTGHPLATIPTPGPAPDPDPTEPDFDILIIAALANPFGGGPEDETVTLLNRTPESIDLTGWTIRDKGGHAFSIPRGVVSAGGTITIHLPETVQLGNKGGTITLLNKEGIKVHGVKYTRDQAREEGWTIVF